MCVASVQEGGISMRSTPTPASSAPPAPCKPIIPALIACCRRFKPSQEGGITMMLDTDPSTTKPTGANIKARVCLLVGEQRQGWDDNWGPPPLPLPNMSVVA